MPDIDFSLPSGTAVGHYRVVRGLARGGMAEVYIAVHQELRTRRALKKVHRADMIDRLLFEGKSQAKLDSSFVVPVTDLVHHDGDPVLVMPLVEGCPLSDLVTDPGVGLPEMHTIVGSIARALAHAHASGIAHRDLKPANVLVDVNYGELRVRVADFGIARPADAGPEDTVQFIGTPQYASPEQRAHAADLGIQTDLWSLGVLVYELLHQKRPFDDARSASDLEEMASRLPFEQMDAPWNRLLPQLLHPDPTQRLSAADLVSHVSLGTIPGTTPLAQAVVERAQQLDFEVRDSKITVPPSDTETSQARHNLPLDRDILVGRGPLMERIATSIAEGASLITLLGPGGVGKTRVALRIGHDRRSEFPGGVCFCDLGLATTPAEMVWAVATALDVVVPKKGPTEAVVRALQARGRCLMVLDNVEQLLPEACETLRGWVAAAPRATFLITSQTATQLHGEHLVEVPMLDPADALELFEIRAKRVHATFDLEDHPETVELLERLDHLPLAIGLVAGRVAMVPPKQMLAHSVLHIATRPAGTSKHDALRTTFEWSWSQLEPWARQVMGQLAAFHQGFDADAFETVVVVPDDAPVGWSLDVLQWLSNRSWVRPLGDGRFALLNSVQDFVASRSDRDIVEPARDRHATYYARLGRPETLAATRLKGGAQVMQQLMRELPNVRAACEHCLRRGEGEGAVATARAAWKVYASAGPIPEGLRLLEQVADGVHDLPAVVEAQLLCDLGDARRSVGRADDALGDLARASVVATEVGDTRTQVLSHLRIGWTTSRRDGAAAAIGHFEDAVELAGEDAWLQCEATLHLGLMKQRAGEHKEAEPLLQEVRRQALALGDAKAAAVTHDVLAVRALGLGRPTLARPLQDRALELARRAGHRHTEAIVLLHLALFESTIGNVETARQRFAEARYAHVRCADEVHQALVDSSLGYLEAQLGRTKPASALLIAAVEGFDKLDHIGASEPTAYLAHLELNRGDAVAASHYLELASAPGDALSPYVKGHIHRARARLIILEGGAISTATAHLERAVEAFDSDGNLHGEGLALADWAHLACESENIQEATRLVHACSDSIAKDANPLIRCHAACAEVHLLVAKGDERALQRLSDAEAMLTQYRLGPDCEATIRLEEARVLTRPSPP